MEFQAKWIQPAEEMGDICPVFQKNWKIEKQVKKAELFLTALGVYTVELNGKSISRYVLAPGWTSYKKRLQYQQYDVTEYEALHEKIIEAFRRRFPEYRTQTEHILALQFGLAEEPQKTADALAEMIRRDGGQMRTGFVGTPYILHVLSDYGHAIPHMGFCFGKNTRHGCILWEREQPLYGNTGMESWKTGLFGAWI